MATTEWRSPVGCTEENPDPKPFQRWCKKHKLLWPKCTVAASPTTGRCVLATADIARGEVVVEVPDDWVLMAENCSAAEVLAEVGLTKAAAGDALEEMAQAGAAIPDADPLREVQGLVLAVMAERALGAKSRWAPYLSYLPARMEHMPLYWSRQELEELRGTAALDKLRGRVQRPADAPTRVEDLFEGLVWPLIEAHPRLGALLMPSSGRAAAWEAYRWATAVVGSYSFQLGDDHYQAMVPIWDLLNHVTGAVNVRLKHDAERGVLQMVATADIPKGCEVVNDYGALSNAELLRGYGYVEAHNPNNHAQVPVQFMIRAAAAALGDDAAPRPAKRARRGGVGTGRGGAGEVPTHQGHGAAGGDVADGMDGAGDDEEEEEGEEEEEVEEEDEREVEAEGSSDDGDADTADDEDEDDDNDDDDSESEEEELDLDLEDDSDADEAAAPAQEEQAAGPASGGAVRAGKPRAALKQGSGASAARAKRALGHGAAEPDGRRSCAPPPPLLAAQTRLPDWADRLQLAHALKLLPTSCVLKVFGSAAAATAWPGGASLISKAAGVCASSPAARGTAASKQPRPQGGRKGRSGSAGPSGALPDPGPSGAAAAVSAGEGSVAAGPPATGPGLPGALVGVMQLLLMDPAQCDALDKLWQQATAAKRKGQRPGRRGAHHCAACADAGPSASTNEGAQRQAQLQALLPPAELLRSALAALLKLMLSRYSCTLEQDVGLLQGGEYQRLPPRHQAAVLARAPEKQCLVEALQALGAKDAAAQVSAAGRAALTGGLDAVAAATGAAHADCAAAHGTTCKGHRPMGSCGAACAAGVPATDDAAAAAHVCVQAGPARRRGEAAVHQGREGAPLKRGTAGPAEPEARRKASTAHLPASAAFSFGFNVDQT